MINRFSPDRTVEQAARKVGWFMQRISAEQRLISAISLRHTIFVLAARSIVLRGAWMDAIAGIVRLMPETWSIEQVTSDHVERWVISSYRESYERAKESHLIGRNTRHGIVISKLTRRCLPNQPDGIYWNDVTNYNKACEQTLVIREYFYPRLFRS